MTGARPAGRPSRAGMLDVLTLGARLAAGALRGGGTDAGRIVCDWARALTARDHGVDADLAVLGRTLELVMDPGVSERILAGRPGVDGYPTGKLKRRAMAFLAPGALTIADGEEWRRLRPFNEGVLGTGHPHEFAQQVLDIVRTAFAHPVHDIDDVRAAMGRAMIAIVIGDLPAGAPDPVADVSALFDAVQRPLRRRLMGIPLRVRRRRLYALLARRWEESGGDGDRCTLLALARRLAPDMDRKVLLQQVPHWMFTFTGSGTDLLARTLALVTSRADVHRRVLDELRNAGPGSDSTTIGRLPWLEACFLESGRLFPPVTRTFHQGPDRRQFVHYFPLLQRDERLGPDVHAFRPERWLAPEPDACAAASNLFLRGARACPGRDLILFVCKAAAARQLGDLALSARQERLASDPLPISFPDVGAPFTSTLSGGPTS